LSEHRLSARIDQARSELAQRLQECPDDSASIDILHEFYQGRIRSGIAARDRLALLSDTAELILHHVCARLEEHSNFAEIDFSLLAIGSFAQGLISPTGPWPVLAICRPSERQSRALSRPALQLIAERFLDRLCEWIERITDGTGRLSWPLVIDTVPVFSKRVGDLRDWLDALPSHATALHAPMLFGARFIGGDIELSQRFIDESASILRQPFQTEVDVAYLSGYFGSALRVLGESFEGFSSEAPERSSRGIEALVSIDQVVRLAIEPRGAGDEGSGSDFTRRLYAFRERWIDAQEDSKSLDRVDMDDFCRSAKDWFEKRFQIGVIESRLAQAILLGNHGLGSEESYEGLSVFGSPEEAFGMLQELAREEIQVLSSRNCRFHLSRIVERLVGQIAKTPSPELTLRNLVSIGRSLGGKGVLWELFSSHALLLELYTRLCGTSPYLVQILLSNPGMIDDLLDSLMLERIPDYQGFQSALEALCKGSHEIDSVVIAFRNAMHLAIGVRDILGRESITEIHRALADVHEVCLHQVALAARNYVASKYPEPRDPDGKPVEMATMLIGKLASREPNYHSDVSMLVVYDSAQASHGVFFHQVAQRMIQMANRVTRYGRLFELNAWSFQGVRSSALAWNIDALLSAIDSGGIPIEHRMNLYTARIIGQSSHATRAESQIERFLHGQVWSKQDSSDLVQWRRNLELTASPENIKRGWGGTLDVEVLAHIYYAKHLHTPKHPWLRGTVERLEALRKNGVLSPEVALQLRDAYYFLRGVESGLRLMNTKLRHDLPKDSLELSKLAYVLQMPQKEQLIESCEHYRQTIRDLAQPQFAQFRASVVVES
jgi:glutamine synthetase adenylyltransferase